MKKLMTLAAAAILFAGFGTIALNAAESEIPAEMEIRSTELKEGLKDDLKNGMKNGLAQGSKNGLAQGMKNGLKYGLKNGRKQGLKNGKRK